MGGREAGHPEPSPAEPLFLSKGGGAERGRGGLGSVFVFSYSLYWFSINLVSKPGISFLIAFLNSILIFCRSNISINSFLEILLIISFQVLESTNELSGVSLFFNI